MKNKELKGLLKDIYKLETSKSEIKFIKEYEVRSMKLLDVIALEMKYMRVTILVSVLLLIMTFILLSKSSNSSLIWYVSSFLPYTSLSLFCILRRSERYRMSEIETSTRFSLMFIRTIRLLIVGTISLMVLLMTSLILKRNINFNLLSIICLVGTPYLLNVWANLLLTRKIHSNKNLLFSLGISIFSCLLPYVIKQLIDNCFLNLLFINLIFIIVVLLVAKEAYEFVKGNEELSWN